MTAFRVEHQLSSHSLPRTKFTSVAIFLVALASPNLSFAVPDIDQRSTFVVGGLSFFCSNCETSETKGTGENSEELCEIETDTGRLLDSCSNAITLLLRQALKDPTDAKSLPTVNELRAVILKPSPLISAYAVEVIIQLLLRSTEGRQVLIDHAEQIVRAHGESLLRVYVDWAKHPSVVKAVWNISGGDGSEQDGIRMVRMQLRLLAALSSTDLGLGALLADLGVLSTDDDVKRLRDWSAALEQAETIIPSGEATDAIRPFREDVTDLADALTKCLYLIKLADSPQLCDAKVVARTEPVSPAAQHDQAARQAVTRYFERRRLKLLLEHADTLAPSAFLSLLASADLANYRTPQTLLAARRALQQLQQTEDGAVPPELVVGSGQKMFRVLAESDVELALLVGRLFVQTASSQFNLGEFENGIKSLEESLLVYPSPMEIRLSLIDAMLRTRAVSDNSRLQGVFDDLRKRSGARASNRTFFLVFILVLASTLGLLIMRWGVKRFAKTDAESMPRENAANLNPIERAELRSLLNYFGLPGYADAEQLAQEYRQKAKVLHPDAETGEHEEFVKLREKFERAQELIAKR